MPLRGEPGSADFLRSVITFVHEGTHAFTASVGYGLRPADSYPVRLEAYYLSADQFAVIPYGDAFSSLEFVPFVPPSLRTHTFDLYIGPKSIAKAQVSGIYGILDEWHAYVHGFQATVALLPAFQKKDEVWAWVNSIADSYHAGVQFKYYMMMYLKQARSAHRDQYDSFLGNKDMVRILRAVDEQGAAVLASSEAALKKAAADLHRKNPYGGFYGEKEGYFYFGDTRQPLYSEIGALVRTELMHSDFEPVRRDFGLR